MREKKLEKWLGDRIKKELNGWFLKFWPAYFTGFPDRLAIIPGGFIWFVETKTELGKLSPRQRLVHKQLLRMGFRVACVHDKIQGSELLNDMHDEVFA